jgi:ribosomal protein S18 acetylase RimI-like enzyme
MSKSIEQVPVATSTIPVDPLENVVWSALTTRHRDLAEGSALGRRYPAAIAPFAGISSPSEEAFAALQPLVPPGDRIAFFTVDPIVPPAGMFDVQLNATAEQMVAPSLPEPRGHLNTVRLTEADVPEMIELVALTKPGPFAPRTIELGGYVGIRVDGRLAAMTGERIHLDGFTEVSAVCVHPDYRGRGFAAELILLVAQQIRRRGDVPFLHVFSDNAPAIALYAKLGFVHRRTVRVTVLASAA